MPRLFLLAAFATLAFASRIEELTGKFIGGAVRGDASVIFHNDKNFISVFEVERRLSPDGGSVVLSATVKLFAGANYYTCSEPVLFPHQPDQNNYLLACQVHRWSYTNILEEVADGHLSLSFQPAQEKLTVSIQIPVKGLEVSLASNLVPGTSEVNQQTLLGWVWVAAKYLLIVLLEAEFTGVLIVAWDVIGLSESYRPAYQNFVLLTLFVAADFHVFFTDLPLFYHWFSLSSTIAFVIFVLLRLGMTLMKIYRVVVCVDDDDDINVEAFLIRMWA